MSISSIEIGRPVYFLLNFSGLTIFDIRLSKLAPRADAILLGGLVNAISTFSDSVIDGGISSESGTLNVIEREGQKIMFERGSQIEAILIVDKESQLLMEKIRAIIDVFEHNYLEEITGGNIVVERFIPFRELTRKFILSHIDENLVFTSLKDDSKIKSSIEIPPKFRPLLTAFDGKKSIIEVGRALKWPPPYVVTRTAMLQELGFLKPVDISIKDTDIFQIEEKHIGILLEQGGAFQMISKHWGEWGVKIVQSIDGKHTIASLSKRFTQTSQDQLRLTQMFRWLSIRGYISLLTDYELLLIVFEEFLKLFRQHLLRMFGDDVTFMIFEKIFHQDLELANDKGRIICVAKLVENYRNELYFDKLEAVMKSRSQIMLPLFQHAFFPFLDNVIRVLTNIIGRDAVMDLMRIAIVETEQYYGTLVYDILFEG
jgi:hypothetical protein